MMMKLLALLVCSALMLPLGAAPQKVRFAEDCHSLLRNPCMGWGLYVDGPAHALQADEYWKRHDDAAVKYASFLCVRWSWADMEPEEGQYAWKYNENFKRLLAGAQQRGLKLCFRIDSAGADSRAACTPDYVRQAGAQGYSVAGASGEQLWTPFPDDPVFWEKLEKFIVAFAEVFDDAAMVDFVEVCHLSAPDVVHEMRLPQGGETMLKVLNEKILSLYSRNFKNIITVLPMRSRVDFPLAKKLAGETGGCGFRCAGLGGMKYGAYDEQMAEGMYGKSLLIGESCEHRRWAAGVCPQDGDEKAAFPGMSAGYERAYKQALEGHCNTLDLRMSPGMIDRMTGAEDLLKGFISKGGYRVRPVEIAYHDIVFAGAETTVTHSWVNAATGYLPNNAVNWRHKYKPAFAIIDATGKVVDVHVDNRAEPSSWLAEKVRGYEFTFIVNRNLRPGTYQLAVAIVDTEDGNKPAIKLAIDQVQLVENWCLIGEIRVRDLVH